jgi:polyhydroxyalkanoate synthesis regulator phasin
MKDWITIGSVLAVILGWFINSHLNRRHEVFKRRMDLRFGMYETCIAVSQVLMRIVQSKDISKEELDPLVQDFMNKLELCQIKVHMYGTQREIESIAKIAEYAQRNEHDQMKDELVLLTRSILNSVRKDLRLPKSALKI